METQYRAVNGGKKESRYWSPFLKQLHVSSGVWALYFMNGLAIGAPTVFIPQIRRDWNSTVTVDDELASWFYSASNLAALPWVLVLPALSQSIGRRIPYLVCCITMSVAFALLYFSSAPHYILIAQAIHGFSNAIIVTILIHIIPEYSNRKYRSIFLNIQGTNFFWGMWIANAIGTFLPWKYITVLGLVSALYTFTVSCYPESPRWLASKGKFTECETVHRWLHGSSPEAEEELRTLIKSQAKQEDGRRMTCIGIKKTLSSKQFYMPLLLAILLSVQYNLSGKFVCSVYAIEIFKKITRNVDDAYTGMLVLDGVTLLGMYIGSFMSKIFKLRTLFFSLSYLSIVVMFAFSLYLYLASLGVISENNIVTLSFLVLYSLAFSGGPITLFFSFSSTIISIRHQSVSYGIVSIIFLVLCSVMLKFTLGIFSVLGLHGTFLFYGLSCGIATTVLYVYLPETKDKTLEEIEEYFKDTKKIPEAETLTRQVDNEIKH